MHDADLDTTRNSELNGPSLFSRWSSLTFMIAILMVAGLISALTAMRFAIRGREVEVPMLTTKTKDEAEQILRAGVLKRKVSSPRLSPGGAEGRVLEQFPPGGTRLKSDRTVKVLISLGEQRFAVPNLL